MGNSLASVLTMAYPVECSLNKSPDCVFHFEKSVPLHMASSPGSYVKFSGKRLSPVRANSVERSSEDFICAVCGDIYDVPRSLQCSHSFCESCLVGIQVESGSLRTITCPECRANCELPQSGVEGLPVNHKLKRTLEFLSPQDKEAIMNNSTLLCSLHTHKHLEYYCEQCKQLICGQCMLDRHRSHKNIGYALDFLESHIYALEQLVLPATDRSITQANKALYEIDADSKELQQAEEYANESIRGYFEKIRGLLARREQELLDEVLNEARQKKRVISKIRADVEKARDGVQKCRDAVAEIENKRANDIRIFIEEDHIKSQMQSSLGTVDAVTGKITKRTIIPPPFPDEKLEESIKMLGALPMMTTRHTLHSIEVTRPHSHSLDLDMITEKPTTKDVKAIPKVQQNGRDSSSPGSNISPMRREAYRNAISEIRLPILEFGSKTLSGTSLRSKKQEVYPCGVCVGQNKTIIVTNALLHSFCVLTSTGRCIDLVGQEGRADGQFVQPTAVITDADGNIIVSDLSPRIQKFSPSGQFISKFNTKSLMSGSLLGEPWGLAVTRDNKLLVSDWDKSCIQIFDKSGKYQGKFGRDVELLMRHPAGIAIDERGRVIVPDRGLHCFWIFAPDGQLLGRFSKQGYGAGELYYPFGVAIDKEGKIYISESGNHRISVFTAGGKFVKMFGVKGSDPGMFDSPHHLFIDQQQRLIVADEQNQRLQIFSIAD